MDPHIQLAKQAIETYLKTGQILKLPENLPKEMLEKKAGVFVSLHVCHPGAPHLFLKRCGAIGSRGNKQLRGCIGTFLPIKQNIAQEIIANAISAAFQDPRFLPITLDELPNLEISVDVLSEPSLCHPALCHPGGSEPLERSGSGERPIGSRGKQLIHNYLPFLDPKKYGILVRSSDNRSGLPAQAGLLLPDLPTIDTPEKQISIALQKAGLNPQLDEFEIYRFTVERHR